MRCRSLCEWALAALALASLSCAKQPPETEFIIKARLASNPGAVSSDVSVTVRRDPRSSESRRTVDFQPPLYLGQDYGGMLNWDFAGVVMDIAGRVLETRIFYNDSRRVMVDANVSLNDMMTMNPFKATHVWEIYEPEPAPSEKPDSMTTAGEPQSRIPAAALKKRPGFVCAKLAGKAKKNSVSSMEIWIAAPDSPYAAAFRKR